jgi:WD40 repeat protein
VALSESGELVHRDLPTGQVLWKVAPHRVANAIAFSPDGKFIATAGPYGLRDNLAVVELWETTSGKNLFSYSPGITSCDCVAFSPEGTRLAVGGRHEDDTRYLYIWSTTGKQLLHRESESAQQLSFSPDGRLLALMPHDIHLCDAGTGDVIGAFRGSMQEGFFGEAYFHPDNKTFVGTMHRSEPLPQIDQGLIREWFDNEANPFQTGIDYFTQKLTANPPKSFAEVVRWDVGTGDELGRWPVHLDQPVAGSGFHGGGVALSLDGTRFAYAEHNAVELWEV